MSLDIISFKMQLLINDKWLVLGKAIQLCAYLGILRGKVNGSNDNLC